MTVKSISRISNYLLSFNVNFSAIPVDDEGMGGSITEVGVNTPACIRTISRVIQAYFNSSKNLMYQPFDLKVPQHACDQMVHFGIVCGGIAFLLFKLSWCFDHN
jgi:hypothetical protein